LTKPTDLLENPAHLSRSPWTQVRELEFPTRKQTNPAHTQYTNNIQFGNGMREETQLRGHTNENDLQIFVVAVVAHSTGTTDPFPHLHPRFDGLPHTCLLFLSDKPQASSFHHPFLLPIQLKDHSSTRSLHFPLLRLEKLVNRYHKKVCQLSITACHIQPYYYNHILE
jgi:hypothetical protein